MFRKRNLWFLTIASCVIMVSGGAFATGEPYTQSYTYKYDSADSANGGYSEGRPIVASKAYVDSNDDKLEYEIKNKIPYSATTKVVTTPATDGGNATARDIATSISVDTSSDNDYIPTVGAVEGLVTAQATTNASTYQPKATADSSHYQVGTNGTWKQLADGTYVKPTAVGNNVKLDIDSDKIATTGPAISSLTSSTDSGADKIPTAWAVNAAIESKGYEANVQADWTVTDSSSDAYIAHKPNGTSGNIMTYTGTEGVYSSMGVDTGIDSASTDSDVATAKAVYSYHDATKVNVNQGVGKKVLTTGTNGTVTAEYLKVPVTPGGEPTDSMNSSITTASMWLE